MPAATTATNLNTWTWAQWTMLPATLVFAAFIVLQPQPSMRPFWIVARSRVALPVLAALSGALCFWLAAPGIAWAPGGGAGTTSGIRTATLLVVAWWLWRALRGPANVRLLRTGVTR